MRTESHLLFAWRRPQLIGGGYDFLATKSFLANLSANLDNVNPGATALLR